MAIARYMVSSEEMDSFSLISYSLALSLLNFIVSAAFYQIFSVQLPRIFRRKMNRQTPFSGLLPSRLSLSFTATVLGFSVTLGLIAGYAYSSDLLLSSLRRGPFARELTKRSVERPLAFLLAANRKGELEEGRPNALKQRQVWVEVYLKEGKKVFAGYPEFFPVGEKQSEIFLSPACILEPTLTAWPGPGVLIREEEISYIAFVDRERSACHNLWRSTAKLLQKTVVNRP